MYGTYDAHAPPAPHLMRGAPSPSYGMQGAGMPMMSYPSMAQAFQAHDTRAPPPPVVTREITSPPGVRVMQDDGSMSYKRVASVRDYRVGGSGLPSYLSAAPPTNVMDYGAAVTTLSAPSFPVGGGWPAGMEQVAARPVQNAHTFEAEVCPNPSCLSIPSLP